MKALYGNYQKYTDVSDILDKLNNQKVIKITICNQLFGDPIPGERKILRIFLKGGLVKTFKEGEIINLVKSLSDNHMKNVKQITHVGHFLSGKKGLEIGGPSLGMRDLGVYTACESLDNANFSTDTLWNKNVEGSDYKFAGKSCPGKTYIADVVDLSRFSEGEYDFVFGSHMLEHLINPLKALEQMTKVIKSDGMCILILPFKEMCFDHRRPITSFSELLQHYKDNRDETDPMDHMDEILRDYDLSRDPPAGTEEEFIERCKKHYENRALHVHVFDFKLIIRCLTFFKYKIIHTELFNDNQIVIGQRLNE